MDAFLQQFQHLRIRLEEIISATNNFNDENRIGVGGFGKVYKGELSRSNGRSMVAIKRLDPKNGQGIPEFLKEITTLSRYRHENLVSLLGFCYQGDEMILVYNYASRGSLDRYLNSTQLTWFQRLKICLDAAKGLNYLHDPGKTHQRLIHCDVKSANILIDEQWNGKVSDFGLSTMGPANEQDSVIVIHAVGTHGYIDPQYRMTNTLTKESDIYSFGVVLFEVLFGRLCCTYSNGHVQQILVPTWIESYKQKKLNDIIFKDATIQPLGKSALEIFSNIAYRCLKEYREDRPKIAEVVTELEAALKNQELVEHEMLIEQPFFNEEVTMIAETLLGNRSEVELRKLLSKGILLNGGKTYFSLNKEGEQCEMISIAECLGSDVKSYTFSTEYNSRFAVGTYHYFHFNLERLKTHVKTQFLSPGVTYTVNLVFMRPRMKTRSICYVGLTYKLQEEAEYSVSHMAYEREDGWWMCELYQFTTDHRTIDLQILFDDFSDTCWSIEVEGIEFRPMEKVQHKDENQPISDSDINLEENMPTDYEDIMKLLENNLQWTTKEEAYSIIRKGFFISVDKEKRGIWFYLDKNGKKGYMWHLGAYGRTTFFPESRFGEVVQWDSLSFIIDLKVQSQLLSSETTYAIYLVYKFPKDQSRFEAPVLVNAIDGSDVWYICLTRPQTPVIRQKANQNTHNPVNRPKMKGFPQQRNDGWMEVQIWEWETPMFIYKQLMLTHLNKKSGKVIIEGIEFRPI